MKYETITNSLWIFSIVATATLMLLNKYLTWSLTPIFGGFLLLIITIAGLRQTFGPQ